MLRLHTLGGCHLERDDARLDAVSAQRKALALLATLAAAGARGVSREVVAARLWPDSDDERARLSLRQLLHALRAQLGAPDPIAGTAELRLDPLAIASDVGDFRDALRRDDDAAAVALYAGPFLDGFYLKGADEFERWASAERGELAHAAARALERVAERAARAGDARAAADAWRRLAAAEPLSARAAVGLMRALDAAGDRAGALRHARVHDALVREELGGPPDPSVAALVAELHRAPAAIPAPGPAAPADAPLDEAHPAADRASPLARPARPARRVGGVAIVASLAGLALAGVGLRVLSDGAPASAAAAASAPAARDARDARDARRAPSAAEEAYRRGRYVFATRTSAEGILQAKRYFEDAIARDPQYARAYAGLSDAYARLAVFGYAPPRETYGEAKTAALRAVALDGTLAEAYAALGHALVVADFDWVASERAFRQAIALDPGYVFARVPFAICLLSQGRFAEATAQLDTARRADPLATMAANVLGRVYVSAGRPDDAIPVLRQVLALNPQIDLAHQQLGHAYLAKGMAVEAIAELRRAAAVSGARDSAQLAYAYAVSGRRGEAERVLRALRDAEARRGDALAYHLAMAYAGLGDRDAAFRWLDRGYAARASFMVGVKVEPGFSRLHGDPRWPALLRRMGLER